MKRLLFVLCLLVLCVSPALGATNVDPGRTLFMDISKMASGSTTSPGTGGASAGVSMFFYYPGSGYESGRDLPYFTTDTSGVSSIASLNSLDDRVFVAQIVDVTAYASITAGNYSGATLVIFYQESIEDTAAAWAGASKFYIGEWSGIALSGNTRRQTELSNIVGMGYLRFGLDASGITGFRNVVIKMNYK